MMPESTTLRVVPTLAGPPLCDSRSDADAGIGIRRGGMIMPGLGFKNSQALATGFRCQEISICELITIVHNPRLVLEVEKRGTMAINYREFLVTI